MASTRFSNASSQPRIVCPVEEIGIEFAFNFERVFLLHEIEEQFEVRELLRIRFDVEVEAREFEQIESGFVDVEHDGHERQAARVAGQFQLLRHRAMSHLLMIIGVEHMLLHGFRKRGERRGGGRVEPQREKIPDNDRRVRCNRSWSVPQREYR